MALRATTYSIMDDCLVFSKKKTHLKHLTDLFKALIRNGLKISPRKCKLFKKSLLYMGHQVSIIENIPHTSPVKSGVEAIVKLDPPKSPKNCKKFCGMVNYLSMFLKDLQNKLIPIYHLTKVYLSIGESYNYGLSLRYLKDSKNRKKHTD